MSDRAEPKVEAGRGASGRSRVRRSLSEGRIPLSLLIADLVDRHTRFMAFVWGPDWEACHPNAMARATERRRSDG
jgi:hypothetical protein